jgi:hypothetical protein
LIDIYRIIRILVLKLDFTAHGIIESLSEFGPGDVTLPLSPTPIETILLLGAKKSAAGPGNSCVYPSSGLVTYDCQIYLQD